jgi:hypothetical protein
MKTLIEAYKANGIKGCHLDEAELNTDTYLDPLY